MIQFQILKVSIKTIPILHFKMTLDIGEKDIFYFASNGILTLVYFSEVGRDYWYDWRVFFKDILILYYKLDIQALAHY